MIDETISAKLIQRLARGALARKKVRNLLLSQVEAIQDAESGYTFFYNVKTKESSWELPLLLKNKFRIDEKDILTPRSRNVLCSQNSKPRHEIAIHQTALLSKAIITLQSRFRKKIRSKSATIQESHNLLLRSVASQTVDLEVASQDEKNIKQLSQYLELRGLHHYIKDLVLNGIDSVDTLGYMRKEDVEKLSIPIKAKSILLTLSDAIKQKGIELKSEDMCFPAVLENLCPTGKKPSPGDFVRVHYRIKNITLDSLIIDSYKLGIPLTFEYGYHEVCPGFENLVSQIKVGEKITKREVAERLLGPIKLESYRYSDILEVSLEVIDCYLPSLSFNEIR